MKSINVHCVIILILFPVYFYNVYSQETKISLCKSNFQTDTLISYTFSITPYKGDSSYKFEIFLVDSSSEKTVLITCTNVLVEIKRIEKEVFYRDKFGNKLATFRFEYIIKNSEEYSDDYLKIPVSSNKKTLDGVINLKPGKKYKFVFNNSRGVTKEFDINKGEIIKYN